MCIRDRNAREPNGVIVVEPSPMALADAVLELLRNGTRRAALGDAARATVLEQFTIEHFTTKYERLYETLAWDADAASANALEAAFNY